MDVFPCPSLGEMGHSVLSGSYWLFWTTLLQQSLPLPFIFFFIQWPWWCTEALSFDTHEPHDYVTFHCVPRPLVWPRAGFLCQMCVIQLCMVLGWLPWWLMPSAGLEWFPSFRQSLGSSSAYMFPFVLLEELIKIPLKRGSVWAALFLSLLMLSGYS